MIACKDNFVWVFEYEVVNYETFKLEHKKAFDFEVDGHNELYYSSESSAMCVFKSDISSNDDINNHDVTIGSEQQQQQHGEQQEKYEVLLFGGGSSRYCQWLSLYIDRNNLGFIIKIDKNKTDEFQNIDVDAIEYGYTSFGYTKWKHYLFLFGGKVGIDSHPTHLIFYFDFIQMKWNQSLKV